MKYGENNSEGKGKFEKWEKLTINMRLLHSKAYNIAFPKIETNVWYEHFYTRKIEFPWIRHKLKSSKFCLKMFSLSKVQRERNAVEIPFTKKRNVSLFS